MVGAVMGCAKVTPAVFWTRYRPDLIVNKYSDQGPLGGVRRLISMAKNPSLQDLEGEDWGEPTYESYLVRTVHALRRKPLVELTVDDLRIMLGQAIGMNHLVPLALTHLERDAFVAGDLYPGDLLGVVMGVGAQYWRSHPTEAARMRRVADQAEALLDGREETDEIRDHLTALMVARPWDTA